MCLCVFYKNSLPAFVNKCEYSVGSQKIALQTSALKITQRKKKLVK